MVYQIPTQKPLGPSLPPHHKTFTPQCPIKTIEVELLGFYDRNRSVYIDRITGLFRYNFNSPPRVHQRASIRRRSGNATRIPRRHSVGSGVRPVSGLLPRMRRVQKPKYRPYFGSGAQVQAGSMQEREAVSSYVDLRGVVDSEAVDDEVVDDEVVDDEVVDDEVVDGEVLDDEVADGEVVEGKVVNSEVLEKFMTLLKERGRARRAEEAEDMEKVGGLCREFGLSMEDLDEISYESVDGGVKIQEIGSTSDGDDNGGGDSSIDSADDSDKTFTEGSGEEDSTEDDMDDGEEEEEEELENLDVNETWETEANQSFLSRICSVFGW